MGPLDNLPKIFDGAFLKQLRKLNLVLKILSDNHAEKITYNDNRTVILINTDKLDPQESESLTKTIRKSFIDEGSVLETNVSEVVDRLVAFTKDDQVVQTLGYFKGKIPTSDIEILRASLFLQNEYERHDIALASQHKSDIIQKYGERGKNIANLCSAGYFDTQIKPLYEKMFDDPETGSEAFATVYEIIVTESPYAVFINSIMSQDEANLEILERVEVSKKYGINHLNIHGIGKDNVRKIDKFLEEKKDVFCESPQNISRGENFVVVRISFICETD